MRTVSLVVVMLVAAALGSVRAQPLRVQKHPTLSVGVKPPRGGRVTSEPKGIKCAPNCDLTTRKGAVVTLRAKAAKGWRFRRWGLGCRSTRPICKLKMTKSRFVAASFVMKTRTLPPPPPPAPPPPPPPPPPNGFTPQFLAGNWTGKLTNNTANTSGGAALTVKLVQPSSFTLQLAVDGAIFGCSGSQTLVSATVDSGLGGPNQWSAAGFAVQTIQDDRITTLNYDYILQSLDGSGSPACNPSAHWVLTGGFAGNTFTGTLTITFEGGPSVPAVLNLARTG
jgi:hypothetical protein